MRKIIAFGGSAGGIEALSAVLEKLPATLDAASMAVIHTSEQSTMFAEVLARRTSLKVISPLKEEPIKGGMLYVPRANRHLVVRERCVVSIMGPRENRHRPAVDTLFRSAARAFRSHVIGVILSGALDDGVAGALAIKARGGIVIVQDPSEARQNGMPSSVLNQVKVDHCLPLRDIPGALIELASKGRPLKQSSKKQCQTVSMEFGLQEMEPTGFSCPECDGALLEIPNGKSVQFRCHVGHTFSLESFSEAQANALERALWVALRRLNEQRSIQATLARNTQSGPLMKRRFHENAAVAEQDMRLLHEILARL